MTVVTSEVVALKRTGKAILAVRAHAFTMFAIEAQHGQLTGDHWMAIENARIEMRARVDELEATVRSDLESL